MAEEDAAGSTTFFGLLLLRFAKGFAFVGGAILALLTLVAVVSIGGRLVGRPIQGDFELAQMTCAVAVAFFLPYCQVIRANIIVDFFTIRTSRRTRKTLDAVGALAFSAVMALLAWRTLVGALAMKSSNETSMIMGLPIWYAYALATPALALTAVVGMHTAYLCWKSR